MFDDANDSDNNVELCASNVLAHKLIIYTNITNI